MSGLSNRCMLIAEFLRKHAPIINSLFYFSKETHLIGLRKFAFLWFLASSPIIFSVFLSSVPDGDETISLKLLTKVTNGVSLSDLFVYSASFLSPLLYILFERIDTLENEPLSDKLNKAMKIFKGYRFLWFSSAALLILTALGFAVENGYPGFKNTFLYTLLSDNYPWLYLFSLICFYLSILDSVKTPSDYVDVIRGKESGFNDSFAKRINEGRG